MSNLKILERHDLEYQKILKMAQENGEIKMKTEQKRVEVIKIHNDMEMDLFQQKMAFWKVKMSGTHQLMSTWAKDMASEEFRHSCRRIIRLFKRFEMILEDSVKEMTEKIMLNNSKLKISRNLLNASLALQNLSEAVQNLHVVSDSELLFDYGILQMRTAERCHQIQTKLNQMMSEVETFKKKYGNPLKRLFQAKEMVEDKVVALESQYGNLKNLIDQLKELVGFYNIPASRRLLDNITQSFASLSSQTPGINYQKADLAIQEHL